MSGHLVLVHGAGSGPWVFDDWDEPPGIHFVKADLHEGIDVATASMSDYASALARACADLDPPLGLCGWSMGGLVTMMAAGVLDLGALVLLEPSPPAEVQGSRELALGPPGTFDPEEAYGTFPEGIPSRPESSPARAQRKAGISVPDLPPCSLVVYGDEFEVERGKAIVSRYAIEGRHFPGVDHWGLISSPDVRRVVLDYVARSFKSVGSNE